MPTTVMRTLTTTRVHVFRQWSKEWDAETLFLNEGSGVGLLVQPRPCRAVLMHQDVLHRVSAPSLAARRPRYSLVWKLCLVPRAALGAEDGGDKLGAHEAPARRAAGLAARETICRKEWGAPTRLG